MENEATKIQDNQLVLFSGGEAVEDLIYEFLKDRSPLTERAYQQDLKAFFEFTAKQFGLPRSVNDKLLFEEIRRVHVVKYKNFWTTTRRIEISRTHPTRSIEKFQPFPVFFNFYYAGKSSK